MNRLRIAALASGFALSISALAEPPRPLDPPARTILNLRLSAAVLETFGEQGGKFAPPYPRFVTLDSILPELPAELRGEMATKDGWANELKILIDRTNDFILISGGYDGKPDQAYGEGFVWEGEATSEFAGTDPERPDRDIIFASADRGIIQRPRRPNGPAAKAAAEIRMIGIAMESYGVDNDVYPGPTVGLQSVYRIADALKPTYIKDLPLFDPWRQPYVVWSNGKSYFIVSRGADWQFDRSYDDLDGALTRLGAPGPTNDEKEDIVFADGQFLRWPAAIQGP